MVNFLANGRTLTMWQGVGQLRLRRDGPVERHARLVELAAWLGSLSLVAVAFLVWSPLYTPPTADLRIAITLSALSGAWPLLRFGFGGVRVETVFDIGAQELRQYRITSGGRTRIVRTLPIDLVDSVHIHRGPPERPAQLVARDAAGLRLHIGTGPLTQLERMHAEIVAALRVAPKRGHTPRRIHRRGALTALA